MPREDPSHGEEKPVHDTAGQKFLSAGRSGVHTSDGLACARKQLFDVRQQPGDRDYKRRTVRHTRRTTATARRRKGAATCERRTVRRSLDDKNREGKKEDGRSNAIRPACNAGRSGIHNERLTHCLTRFCIKIYEACTTMLMCQNKRISTTTTKTLICPGWETAVVPVSQPGTPVRDKRGCPFVPGLATGTEEDLLSRLVTPTGTKGAASAHVAGAPFCPGWCYQPGQNVSFFSCFSFLNSFSISIILLHFN